MIRSTFQANQRTFVKHILASFAILLMLVSEVYPKKDKWIDGISIRYGNTRNDIFIKLEEKENLQDSIIYNEERLRGQGLTQISPIAIALPETLMNSWSFRGAFFEFELEKKKKEVSKLKKKVKVDLSLKLKEKKLKEKAKNLNELVSGVEKKKKSKIFKGGLIQYPVRGEIVSNYGEGKDDRKSKNGLVFKVSKDSFVTSPINGMVVYANQFRSYGNLVIIENDEGFYCILSGMKNILISSGIEVLKGEPIAKLNTGKNNQLYFELRLNGKIINPKSKVEIL